MLSLAIVSPINDKSWSHWNLGSPKRNQLQVELVHKYRPAACKRPFAVWKLLEALDVSYVYWRKVLSTFTKIMLQRLQPKLTCNRGTSFSSERELTEATVISCSSCKLESAQSMTINLRMLTGISQRSRQKRLNLRLWSLHSPPKKESVASGTGSYRPAAYKRPFAVWKLLEALDVSYVHWRKVLSTSAKIMLQKLQPPKLTCNRGTSFSSGR